MYTAVGTVLVAHHLASKKYGRMNADRPQAVFDRKACTLGCSILHNQEQMRANKDKQASEAAVEDSPLACKYERDLADGDQDA